MLPVKVKVCGHVLLNGGLTTAEAFVTANAGVVGVNVGMSVGGAQDKVKFACGDERLFGESTCTRAQPLKFEFSVHVSDTTFCVPANANDNVRMVPNVPSLRIH